MDTAAVLQGLGAAAVLLGLAIGAWDYRRRHPPAPKDRYPSFVPLPRRPEAPPPPEHKQPAAKECLVTGANGFLGSTLVELLLEQGWTVRALVRPGSDPRVLSELSDPHLAIVRGDINDLESLRAAVSDGLPVIFHVAAQLGTWFKEDDDNYRVNVLGTRNVVDVALAKGVGQLIYTSSVSVHADAHAHQPLQHDSPRARGHFASYSQTKALGEDEVMAGIRAGLWATILGPGSIMGKYDLSGLGKIPALLSQGLVPAAMNGSLAAGQGRAIANAHIQAAWRGRLGHRYLLAGPESSLFEAIRLILLELGRGQKMPWVIPRWFMVLVATAWDASSAITGWRPAITTEDIAMTNIPCNISSADAEAELGYEHVPLPDLVREMVQWQLSNDLLGRKV